MLLPIPVAAVFLSIVYLKFSKLPFGLSKYKKTLIKKFKLMDLRGQDILDGPVIRSRVVDKDVAG